MQPARLLCPWDYPGKNTGVGCHALLRGILPTQGLKPYVSCIGRHLPLAAPGKPFLSAYYVATTVLFITGIFIVAVGRHHLSVVCSGEGLSQ